MMCEREINHFKSRKDLREVYEKVLFEFISYFDGRLHREPMDANRVRFGGGDWMDFLILIFFIFLCAFISILILIFVMINLVHGFKKSEAEREVKYNIFNANYLEVCLDADLQLQEELWCRERLLPD